MSGLRESDRWHVLSGDAVAEHEVRAATGVTPLAARVMVARGIRTAADAHAFLTPSLARDWLDPRELPGLPAAADRVERAVRAGGLSAVLLIDLDRFKEVNDTLGHRQNEVMGDLLAVVKDEYAEIVKNEVQRAISADEDAISRLCANYIDNIKAYTQRERARNRFTGQYEEPDERLMRSIEEKIDIPESRKDDFRREIMNYIGALAIEGKKFDYKTNERLHRALELKLFEDQKDSIKLTSLVSQVIDKDTQEKIDVVKARLVRDYGYCDRCAADVLAYVASIFARGDVRSSRN